jgi:hypothetical protein
MQISNASPYRFSQTQIDTLKFVGVDLDKCKTDVQVQLAYEYYLREHTKEREYAACYFTTNVGGIALGYFSKEILAAGLFLASGYLGYKYINERNSTSFVVKQISMLSDRYADEGLEKRDAMARAVHTHVVNKQLFKKELESIKD